MSQDVLSGTMEATSAGEIRVLHVDDDSAFGDLTAEQLRRLGEDVAVTVARDAEEGLERLAAEEFDCVVSDYNMPGRNGIEFLQAVREDWPDLPFILFTGRGSEEIASDAISAGVTDYLQKGGGTDQYTVLLNRVENAVAQFRAEKAVEEQTEWYSTILEHASDYVMVVNTQGEVEYISPSVTRVLGYEPEELVGEVAYDLVHPADRDEAMLKVTEVVQNPDEEHTIEFRSKHADGTWRWVEVRGHSLLEDRLIDGILVNVRDITERKERDEQLSEQKARLENITSFMSHDVKNQLDIINTRLELMEENFDSEHLEGATRAVDRVDEMIEKLMEFAKHERMSAETESISLAAVASECWDSVEQGNAELTVDTDLTIEANAERLHSLLENLLLNALEYGGDGAQVWIGDLDDGTGFYVADDGPGIPPEERDQVFEIGHSSASDSTGLGLAIVEQVADTHGWAISVTSGPEGGARFEIHTDGEE
ncbi:PAS domain S-box protein [Halorientalis halophila]|uniref:PAS domain S-box protein n=1 Tax=Halorientalis halophila TaxID=3108499 RepID=UPI00300A2867